MLSQTRPIPRSPDGDNNALIDREIPSEMELPPRYRLFTLLTLSTLFTLLPLLTLLSLLTLFAVSTMFTLLYQLSAKKPIHIYMIQLYVPSHDLESGCPSYVLIMYIQPNVY